MEDERGGFGSSGANFFGNERIWIIILLIVIVCCWFGGGFFGGCRE